MDKYIHIEDLKNYLNRQIRAFEPCPDKYDAAVGIYDGIYQIPVADIMPVRHGRWIGAYNDLTCSCCNTRWDELRAGDANDWGYWEQNPRYCPNCGAKMDGESHA